MKMCRVMIALLAVGGLTALSTRAKAQALAESADSSRVGVVSPDVIAARAVVTYTRPTETTKLQNYLFEAYGPYPIAGAAIAAGINQLDNAPPEWGQGAEGYGKRFASDFGVAAVTTTTRFGLAKLFHEDTLYYRCRCKGVFPRLNYAVISTFTSRRGEDGHREFSFSSLVAPYAGTMTAVYGWYPDRYGAKDGFRMGNYSLLGYIGGNIALEFLYSGPRSLLSHIHLNNSHGAPRPSSNP